MSFEIGHSFAGEIAFLFFLLSLSPLFVVGRGVLLHGEVLLPPFYYGFGRRLGGSTGGDLSIVFILFIR